jgi:hypothetical protein
MKILEIVDDSGFIGIVNYQKYNSFINPDWEFQDIKNRIIEETNKKNLLFWATGIEDTWKVLFTNEQSSKIEFRESKGVIEVTEKKLYLTNYDTLTMAAQFNDLKLPEIHHKELFYTLDNGIYMVKIRQMNNPEETKTNNQDTDFEIILNKITSMPEIYTNNIKSITWFE